MSSIIVTLPNRALEDAKKRAESEGKPLEELIVEALFKQLGVSDPEAKAELHLKLCEKYLSEADELLAKGDYAQASEKAWGAASQMVKALAARRGEELRSHGELHRFVAKLVEELGDRELGRLWRSATSLHQNFYENWFFASQVADGIGDVKEFVEKLKRL